MNIKSDILWVWCDLDNMLLNMLIDKEYNFVLDIFEVFVLIVDFIR